MVPQEVATGALVSIGVQAQLIPINRASDNMGTLANLAGASRPQDMDCFP